MFSPGYDLLDRAARQMRADNVALTMRINALATELKRRAPAEFETWRTAAVTAIRTGNLSEFAANLNARLEELDNLDDSQDNRL